MRIFNSYVKLPEGKGCKRSMKQTKKAAGKTQEKEKGRKKAHEKRPQIHRVLKGFLVLPSLFLC
jgi:hypothetical protein